MPLTDRTRSTPYLALGLCLLLPLPALAQGDALALLELKVIGLEAKDADRIEAELRSALERVPGFRLLAPDELRRRIRKAKLDAMAGLDARAKASGARYALGGILGGLGEAVSLDIKLLDGKTGGELRRASLELPADPAALKARLDELAVELLQPERWVGSLALSVSEPGASILLDGAPVATTPLAEPLTGLAPGKHILMIRKDGFRDFSRFVEIRYDSVARLKVDLNKSMVVGLLYEEKKAAPPPPPRPEPKPLPAVTAEPEGMSWQMITAWSCLGVGLAAAATGGLLAWHANDIERELEQSRPTIVDKEAIEDRYWEGRRYTRWGNIMMITGASVAVASTAFFLWGWLAEPDEPEASTALVPAATAGGMMLSLSGRF